MIRKNIFSIVVAILLLYLSMANSKTFEKVQLIRIPYIDKIVHFGMYFCLTSVLIIEHRKNLKNPASLLLLALIPLSYGILIEVLQSSLTKTRTGDIFDALADASGILVAVLLWLLIRPSLKESVR